MPHQILHEVKHEPNMQERLLRILSSADDRTVHEGAPTERGHTRRSNHSIWAKVTVEEAEALAQTVEGWL